MEGINKDVATDYIVIHYKEIREEIQEFSLRQNFPGILQAIINLLNSLLIQGQLIKVSQHIRFIGLIYQKENDYVRSIIENLFVRSFWVIRRKCSLKQWELLYQRIPYSFKKIYNKQNQTHSI